MRFKSKGLKIKINKKMLKQIGNIATGAVTGAVMGGGPFGAAAGGIGGSMQSAKKFNPVKSVIQGGIAGGAVGVYRGTGAAGKYITPKAKELGTKAANLFHGTPAVPAMSGETQAGPFNLSNAVESVKTQATGILGGVFGPSEAMAADGGGHASSGSNTGLIVLVLLTAGAFFLMRMRR